MRSNREVEERGGAAVSWPARAVWVALLLTLLVPIWWGGDGRFPWDNSIAPAAVLKAIAAKFGDGFFMSYGPVPYYLSAIPVTGVLAVARLVGELGTPASVHPWGFAHPEQMMTLISVAARLVTLVLALAIVWLSVHRAPGPPLRRARWLVPLLFLGSPIFAYYARTSNVDVHYLFWLWLGVTWTEQARGDVRKLAGAAAASALAICSKEQSGPAALVIIACAMWAAASTASVGAGRRLLRAALVAGASLLAYVVAWRLPMNLSGWRIHHEFLFSDAKYGRDFPATLVGFAQLAWHVLGQLPVVLGPLMLAGVLLAILLRVSVRGLGVRTLVCIGYAVGFLGVIGYCYERFLIPCYLLAIPLAARAFESLLERQAHSAGRRALVVALMVGAIAFGGPATSWVMLHDPRLAAERWIRESLPPSATIEVAGNPHYQPRIPAARTMLWTRTDSLLAAPRGPVGDAVFTSSIDAYAISRESTIAHLWDPAHLEAHGYRRRIVFPLSRMARFTRGVEVPVITAHVRDDLTLRVP